MTHNGMIYLINSQPCLSQPFFFPHLFLPSGGDGVTRDIGAFYPIRARPENPAPIFTQNPPAS